MESSTANDAHGNELHGPVPVSPRPHISASLRLSVFKWVVRISRFGLAALFLFTAGAKLAIFSTFVENVGQLLSSSGIDYERWSRPGAVGVIAIEIVIALLLIMPRTVRWGAVAGAILLTAFAGYALYYVYVLQGEPLECGCFGGIIASQLGVSTALRNLALLIPAFLVWWGYRKSAREVAVLKTDSVIA
jgi:hypothetical protein